MIKKIRTTIEKNKLIEQGDFVLAGVSGGADSVCLLLVLRELSGKIGFTLEVVHVEHGIRGDESCKDAVFVEELCDRLQVPCHVCRVDVPAFAKREGLGLEEAARRLRYEAYENVAGAAGVLQVKVALAHHADDNAETMLFQMVRGSGLTGLAGMRESRPLGGRVTVIRPLLGMTRAQIEAYLKQHRQPYCMDSTNMDTDYSRNKIRHEVLPRLAEINPQAVLHMRQSAELLQELSDYVESEVTRMQEQVCEFTGGRCRMEVSVFQAYPHILQTELIHRVIGSTAGSSKDIGTVHVEAVIKLFDSQVGRSINLPYQLVATRVYGGVAIAKEDLQQTAGGRTSDEKEQMHLELGADSLRRLETGETLTLPLTTGSISFRILDFRGEIPEIPKKTYTKWLNYDKIKSGLQIRRRMAGDYLIIDDEGHRKKLKDYFVAEKIASDRRDDIWLLADGAKILWVVGGRISADYKIEGQTKKILEVQIVGGNDCED